MEQIQFEFLICIYNRTIIDPGKYNIIDSPGIDEEKDLKEIQELGGKLKRAFQSRAHQVREIKDVIDNTPLSCNHLRRF